jgi:3-oxoacyl-[acyl-carrier protein] reductase
MSSVLLQRVPSPAQTPIRPSVLVTGGSRGIGRAICIHFGQEGWHVGVHYRERLAEADRTAAAVKDAGGEGFVLQADIRDADQVKTMIRDFVARCGGLDVLVCNAGQASSNLLLRTHPDQWQTVIDTNLTGTFHCLKAAGRIMLARRDGSVVIVSSFAGHRGRAGQAAYATSKAGLLGLVKSAAREWGPSNVRVNAVFPGWHPTEMSASAMTNRSALEDHVLRRLPDRRAVAQTVFHLALLKDASGQVWNLDSRIL